MGRGDEARDERGSRDNETRETDRVKGDIIFSTFLNQMQSMKRSH